jgi:hypothetical protein
VDTKNERMMKRTMVRTDNKWVLMQEIAKLVKKTYRGGQMNHENDILVSEAINQSFTHIILNGLN